jgi:hypothetical protein
VEVAGVSWLGRWYRMDIWIGHLLEIESGGADESGTTSASSTI